MMRNYAIHYPYPLSLALMQEAAMELVGTHDFTGFTASGTSVENKVRTITQASVSIDEKTGFYVFAFSGNGFLYKQVRNMVGTLLKIGNGRMPVSQAKTVLESRARNLAGPCVAGFGFFLLVFGFLCSFLVGGFFGAGLFCFGVFRGGLFLCCCCWVAGFVR